MAEIVQAVLEKHPRDISKEQRAAYHAANARFREQIALIQETAIQWTSEEIQNSPAEYFQYNAEQQRQWRALEIAIADVVAAAMDAEHAAPH